MFCCWRYWNYSSVLACEAERKWEDAFLPPPSVGLWWECLAKIWSPAPSQCKIRVLIIKEYIYIFYFFVVALEYLFSLFQSCQEQVDAVLFLFSFTDRTSFDDLMNQIAKWMGTSARNVVKLVVGTKYPFCAWWKTGNKKKDKLLTWW